MLKKNHIFSANENDFPPQFSFTIDKNKPNWLPLMNDSPMLSGNMRSQDIEKNLSSEWSYISSTCRQYT